MPKSLRIGQYKERTPSAAYRFLGLATNSTSDTTWRDRSGKDNHATLGANLAAATAWATAGYNITTEQSTGATTVPIFLLAADVWDWDWPAGDSFLIFAKGKITTPAATSALLGNSGSVASKYGMRMRTFTTHKTDIAFTDSDGNAVTVTATSGNVSAASPTDKTIAWVGDSESRTVSIYVDGAIDVSGYSVPSDTYKNIGNPFYIGGAPSGSTNFVSSACQFRELHMLVSAGKGLPSNISNLVERLHYTYEYRLTEDDFPA
jgi:hypothetical protein